MLRFLQILSGIAVAAAVLWACAVLLLTRETMLLVVLMAAVAAGCLGLALRARSRGGKMLMVTGVICCVLALVMMLLGILAMQPDPLS